jgi:hypothetical protein
MDSRHQHNGSTLELSNAFPQFQSVQQRPSSQAVTQAWDQWEVNDAGAKELQPAGFAKAMDKQIKSDHQTAGR